MRILTNAGFDWRCIAFFMVDLKQAPPLTPSESPPPPLDFHVIESPEDSCLVGLCDAFPLEQFHLRMIHGGQQCYIAFLNGQLAAYAWVTTSSCPISEIHFHLPAGPGRIYIYDCFVRPDYRRRGIYNSILKKILADYRLPRRPTRYGTACIGVAPGNTASVRGIRRAGFEEIGRVRYLHLRSFSRWYGVRRLLERLRETGPDLISD